MICFCLFLLFTLIMFSWLVTANMDLSLISLVSLLLALPVYVLLDSYRRRRKYDVDSITAPVRVLVIHQQEQQMFIG